MAPIDDLITRCRAAFLAAEFPAGRPTAPRVVSLAAIGTIAPRALTSPLLRDRLAAASLSVAAARPFAGPEALLADLDWTLALVLSPFKQQVAGALGGLAPAAAATGVVDTIVRAGATAIGLNTNSYAAATALGQLLGEASPRRALIAGTGASARSVGFGLRRTYPDVEVGVVGRSAERAEAVVARLGFGQVVEAPGAFGADLVINTTTVGESDDSARLDFDLAAAFGPGVRYFDLNNRPSALQQAALAAGCVTASGVVMQILTNALRVGLVG